MADIAENLRAYLLTSTAVTGIVADRIHENHVPENRAEEYIWFRRASKSFTHHMNSEPGEEPRAVYFDVECCSRDLDRVSDLADAVSDLFPYRGTLGDSTTKGAFVNDQDQDYFPINEATDDGIHVHAVQIEVMP